MAFEDASKAVVQILQDRQNALFNGNPVPWSTAGVRSYTALITDRFNRDKENLAWRKSRDLQKQIKPDAMNDLQMMATQLKVGWMSGMERDLRTQFMSSQSRGRTSQDQTRYSATSTIGARFMLTRFVEMIKGRMSATASE